MLPPTTEEILKTIPEVDGLTTRTTMMVRLGKIIPAAGILALQS